jgi:hypothetical protein
MTRAATRAASSTPAFTTAPGPSRRRPASKGSRPCWLSAASTGSPARNRQQGGRRATEERELPALEELHRRGRASGLPSLAVLGPERLREIEPPQVRPVRLAGGARSIVRSHFATGSKFGGVRSLAWSPCHSFEEGPERTVHWYRSHLEWLQRCRSGAYRDYNHRHYAERSETPGLLRTPG